MTCKITALTAAPVRVVCFSAAASGKIIVHFRNNTNFGAGICFFSAFLFPVAPNPFPQPCFMWGVFLCSNLKKNSKRLAKNKRQLYTHTQPHLHSGPGHTGRSLCDKDTGNCRQSWYRSGRKLGRKSIHQYLHRQTDKPLETSQTLQQITNKYICFQKTFSAAFFTPSSVLCVLFAVNCSGSNQTGQ